VDSDDPTWGCGLLGSIPNISPNGRVGGDTQRMIDIMKASSTFGKVSYWNWNLAPTTKPNPNEKPEHLSKDFIFIPENWGAGVVQGQYLRQAGEVGFLDDQGRQSPATMGNMLLGSNEPDITGSCMGNMFGKCAKSCSDANVAAGNCPAAHLSLDLPPAEPNSDGECNCWQFSHATGVGFWPLAGCDKVQPLPHMWKDSGCVSTVMKNWKETAQIATAKGYKFLSTPLYAVKIDHAKKFIEHACGCSGGQCSCTDASCGCPAYVGFHFYAYDCRPNKTGGYSDFQRKLDAVRDIMEEYDFVKGAIINEIGMLNCRPVSEDPICVPDSGEYPAKDMARHACPITDELPDGLGTFVEKLLDMSIASKTSTGKSVVKGISWFNADMAGGTYNLELFNKDGTINEAGEGYMRGCAKWANAIAAGK